MKAIGRIKSLIITLSITILTLHAADVNAQLTAQEQIELLDQAAVLFRQANNLAKTEPLRAGDLYQQAILRYRRIIDEGQIVNAALHYNIGNAYLLMGDIGRAILHYRRAQGLGPDNTELAADLEKNLAAALERRRDQIPLRAEKRVMQTLFFWHYDFSLKTKFFLAGVFWTLFCIVLCIHWWRRRGTLLIWLTVLGLMLSACFAGSVALESYRLASHVRGVIVADEVIARQGDGMNYPESFKEPLHSGTEFDLREQRANWLHIELSNGQDAWIPTQAAELIN